MPYSGKKTIAKALPPLVLVMIVRSLIGTLESQGIYGDDKTVWTLSVVVYSAYLSLANWWKNRKRGNDPLKPIKGV
jgi:hypothetical protein